MNQSQYLKPVINKLNSEGKSALDETVKLAVSLRCKEVIPEHLLFILIQRNVILFENLETYSGLSKDRLKNTLIKRFDQIPSSLPESSPVFSVELVQWIINSWIFASANWGRDQFGPIELIATLLDSGDTLTPQLHMQQALNCDLYKVHQVLRNKPVSSTINCNQIYASSGNLEKYTRNLSKLAHLGLLDPVIGREAEIRQMINILLRRRQNNPILTGEPGVGKTALAEGLALNIAQGSVPPQLLSMEVMTLDLGLLQAGASVKGEFEQRLQSIINEVSNSPHPIILFIDEAHTLIGAGGQSGQNDAANLLKPALARGELRIIAATTWKEYKKYFEKDAALARRFQVVKIAEPDIETATIMMRSIAPALAEHHGVHIMESAIHASVVLSNRYITDRQLPDKSSSLLDTACARVVVSQKHVPKEIEKLNIELESIKDECEALKREDNDSSRIIELNHRRDGLLKKLFTLKEEWEKQLKQLKQISESNDPDEIDRIRSSLAERHLHHAMVFECVDETCIADVVSEWTGIPLGRMLENEYKQLDTLMDRLSEHIVGQQHALNKIVQQIRIDRSGLADPLKPTGVYLLAGPSGTGKTETSIALAELLFGGGKHLIAINMSEYQEAHSVSGLKGAPPGYVGYGQGGVLTEAVRRNPYCVVLLDEIEKAHPDVIELFYQIFDKGIVEDSEGQIINFRNTLIIMTSNLASESLVATYNSGEHNPDKLCDIIRPEFEQALSPALMGRITLLPYLPLQTCEIKKIISLKLEKITKRYLKATRDKSLLVWDDDVIEWIAEHCKIQQSGARDIDHVIDGYILPLLATHLLQSNDKKEIKISILKNELMLSFE